MKTAALFIATNIGILAMLTLFMQVFDIQPYLASQGVHINLAGTLMFAAVFGMAGSFISLMLSTGIVTCLILAGETVLHIWKQENLVVVMVNHNVFISVKNLFPVTIL